MTPSVLVVEDDDDLRTLVAEALAQEHCVVRMAASGEAALDDIAENGRPDLILLDMRMPGMSGADFAHELRRRGEMLTIVVMTAAVSARTLAEEIQAAGWLAKPFSVNQLVAIVRKFLGEDVPRPERGAELSRISSSHR